MDDCTIISYPSNRNHTLLSLNESRSQYLLPFGGRFRVVDFTLRNSFSSGARTTILYNNVDDLLEPYVSLYGPFEDMKFPPIKVISREYSDINVAYHLVMESNTDYFIIHNGDVPTIIDFREIIDRYKNSGHDAVLYCLMINDRPSMAYTVLVADQKSLLSIINQAREEERESPNIFEMIINIMVNQGIPRDSFTAYYWPVKTVPEYFALNRETIWNPEIFGMLYHEKIIKSQIQAEGFAHLGRHAKIANSFISDFCKIDGTVQDSIIYPGVTIGSNTVVRNSIVLPYVRIGSGCNITRAIIDERTNLDPASQTPEIGSHVKIGSAEEFIKNSEYPAILFDSITLVGKNCGIPDGTRIGGGCYVPSGTGPESFANRKHLYDGTTLPPRPDEPGGGA